MVTVTQNDVAVVGLHCAFGAVTDIRRPYRWHWMRNGTLIAGAPSACAYTTPPLRSSDFGSTYSVKVWGLDGEVEVSNEVELSNQVERVAVEADVDPEGEVTQGIEAPTTEEVT